MVKAPKTKPPTQSRRNDNGLDKRAGIIAFVVGLIPIGIVLVVWRMAEVWVNMPSPGFWGESPEPPDYHTTTPLKIKLVTAISALIIGSLVAAWTYKRINHRSI